MKINLPKIYSQLDNRWKDIKIGNSNTTIGQVGCLLTCASMVATYFGHEETPATLVKKVAFSGNLWIWGQLTNLYPDIVFQKIVNTPSPLTTAQMNEIKKAIDEKCPVFLQVDVVPSTTALDEHWVLAVDYNGDDFTIVNPYGGYSHKITDYGVKPQLLIWAYAWYKGNVADNYYKGIDLNNKESVKVCVDTWHQVAVEGLFIKKEDHEKVLAEKENTIANLNQQINNLNAQNTEINQEKNRLADEVEDCNRRANSYKEQFDKVNKELEITRSDIIQLKKEKADWQMREIELNKRIKFLETKLEGRKKPLKDLIVDIWLKVAKG